MDPRHLLEDELLYELVLRDIGVHDPKRLEVLQAELAAEASGAKRSPFDRSRITRNTLKSELNECSMQLQHISKAMEAAAAESNDEEVRKVQSRLMHIDGRIGRLRLFAPDHAATQRLSERVKEFTMQVATVRESLGGAGGAIGEVEGAVALPLEDAPAVETVEMQMASTGAIRKESQASDPLPTSRANEMPQQVGEVETNPEWQNAGASEFMRQAQNRQPQPNSLSDLFSHETLAPGNRFAAPPSQLRLEYQAQFRDLLPSNVEAFAQRVDVQPQPHFDRSFGARARAGAMEPVGEVGRSQPQQHYQLPQPIRPRPPMDQRSDHSQPGQLAINALAGGHWIHKWALWFDGSAKGLDAEDFVFRVERQAQLHGVSDRALVIGVGNLLRDRAAQWFWTYQRQNGNATWAELKRAFIDRYAPCRETDYEIRSKIEARKQSPSERFNDYCQDVEALAVRLNRQMPDDELVEVLRRNMQMGLRKALWQTATRNVAELIRRCNEYERLCSEEQQRKQLRVCEIGYEAQHLQSTDHRTRCNEQLSRQSEMQQRQYEQQMMQYEHDVQQYEQSMQNLNLRPQAANNQPQPLENIYESQQRGDEQWYEQAAPQGSEVLEQIEAIQSGNSGGWRTDVLTCWNCHGQGHVFGQCPQQQKFVFCFTCGLPGHISVTCPKCTLNPRKGKPMSAGACPMIPALPQPPQRPFQAQIPSRPTPPRMTQTKSTTNESRLRLPNVPKSL